MSRALSLTTFAAGSLNVLVQCVGEQSANAASHWLRVPCPLRGHPYRDAQRQTDVP